MKKADRVAPTEPTVQNLEPVTPLMAELLNSKDVVKDIGASADSIDAVLRQIQTDVTSNSNAETVGHQVLALRKVREFFHLFRVKAEALKAENEAKS